MKEVEILVEVFDLKDDAIRKLNSFKFIDSKEVLDVYYFDPLRKDLQLNLDGNLLSCFRLRKKGDKYYLAYKSDNFDQDNIWIYSDESELEVSDFTTCGQIIEKLGLKVLVQVNNTKHIFETNDYEIVLEEVKDLGLFLEVEKKNVEDFEDVNKIKLEIINFIKSLNIKIGEISNKGKPELLLNKKNQHN